MCGICGFINRGNLTIDREAVIQSMCLLLEHRGPDDKGFYSGRGVNLGMRRLSVIDLVTGKQPIHNEDKTVWIVFNGEIYNFKELKIDLEKNGHIFYSNSDTEVIVHLYEEMGGACVSRLNGIFAFAIWDERERILLLARDRFGVKPLYYTIQGNDLIFASELKAFNAHPMIKKEINYLSLRKYLSYGYIPSPRSIFSGINKLPAAHFLTYKEGAVRLNKYWDINLGHHDPGRRLNLKECEGRFLDTLRGAVKRQLNSDVPLGVFLSGGIDSGSIAAMMCQLNVKDINSFSIGFPGSSFDETKYSTKLSQRLGTRHHHKILSSNDMVKLLPKVIKFLDEPFADASIIPTYLLSEFAREYVTVALSGDGGDELLCGYPTYQAHKFASFYKNMPNFLRNRIIGKIVDRLPVSLDNFSLDFKAKRFVSGMDYDDAIRHFIWMGSFTPGEASLLLTDNFKGFFDESMVYDEANAYLDDRNGYSLIEKMQFLDIKTYLQDDILTKMDRASMMCSLEVRVPFLDNEVVDFINSLPEALKLHGLTTKYILKKTMHKLLPSEIINRPKKGFGIPVGKWLKHDLKPIILDVLSEDRIKRGKLFNYKYINKLKLDHFESKKDNGKLLWTLLVFELWRENVY